MSTYVIFYETSIYGAHHFSLIFWNSSENGKTSLKKPRWVDELQQKQPLNDLKKVALHKHSMWSSLVVDILLGNLIGLALLFHTESVCSWVSNFASDFTNELLRSGCVWLMGVPAGFKLNIELAGVLGIISLNTIQIWSTLSIFVDMIAIATLHVSTLHWLISILYSQQLHVLAALWRPFRGRKWNPLRQRLDSFDYTVKQHVVGSLLFTPLLLLLPTISVFYIFFTIMNTAISHQP
ncbi:hypothetical protein CRYUN_Cryun36dG0045000 [Craigia yunnanensis]